MLDTRTTAEATPPADATHQEPAERGMWIAVLFAATSFLGAGLLFMVQPLAAKLILPSFGGSATVWSTSSLFFQVLLLLGYVYAHLSSQRLGARWQPRFHLLVLVAPLLFLPVTLPAHAAPEAGASPTLWLLRTLTLMIGVPFLVLSATGPLIQRWYSWSGGPRAEDPYFLFAGSNLGSFVGLLCYPFLIEPMLTLPEQRWTWTAGLCVFLVLMAGCGLAVRAPRQSTPRHAATGPGELAPTRPRRLTWCALAFLPSCLMLAATAHISTDVAPIPLVWVLPLAVYLASFVAAFARRTRRPPTVLTRAAVVSAVLSGLTSLIGPTLPVWLVILVDLSTVALVSYAAHARLAATRPAPAHLTGFYLVVSVGGALGGLVNGLLAPLLLNRVWEYGLSLAAVPLLMLGLATRRRTTWITRRYHPGFRLVLGSALAAVALLGCALALVEAGRVGTLAVVGVLVVIAFGAWTVTTRPGMLAVCLLLATGALGVQQMASSMHLDRTFYGSYRVTDDDGAHRLIHGTTVHGLQWQDPARRDQATAYYAAGGPLGAVLGTVEHSRTAVVGLGTGAIATYGAPGDDITFFEIDPAIEAIAENDTWFTFLDDSPADVDVVIGDGRLELTREPAGSFDVIVLDAFSSDSIPVHLLTREAVEQYVDRLAPGGSLVVHISNRVFDLGPVLSGHAASLGWNGLRGLGSDSTGSEQIRSDWVVLTPDDTAAARLLARPGWSRLAPDRQVVWTDDYASVLSVLR